MLIKNQIESNFLMRKTLDNTSVFYLFSKLREFLESKNLKKDLLTLNLYANWLLHQELDNNAAQYLVILLKEKIKIHYKTKNDINKEIFQLLNLDKLTTEITKAFNLLQIDANNSIINLNLIFPILLTELIKKPLKIKTNKIPENSEFPDDFYGIKLINIGNTIHWEILSVSLEKINSRIVGPIVSSKNYSIKS